MSLLSIEQKCQKKGHKNVLKIAWPTACDICEENVLVLGIDFPHFMGPDAIIGFVQFNNLRPCSLIWKISVPYYLVYKSTYPMISIFLPTVFPFTLYNFNVSLKNLHTRKSENSETISYRLPNYHIFLPSTFYKIMLSSSHYKTRKVET